MSGCGYEHGWSNEQDKSVEGKEGDFFQLPIKVERTSLTRYWEDRQVPVFACPRCSILFAGL